MPRKATQAVAEPQTFLNPATLPEIYGLQCVGDCMAPEIPDGVAPEVLANDSLR